ncbi:hypothetical protein A4S06_04925 [Erysipelotrichaceae bacterium MTC7]|nr:hypothetical protein A4S06_04925 [Erysipelotrichaceae bacterium MTC7]
MHGLLHSFNSLTGLLHKGESKAALEEAKQITTQFVKNSTSSIQIFIFGILLLFRKWISYNQRILRTKNVWDLRILFPFFGNSICIF